MASRQVAWPVGKETEADAYAAWTDTHWPGYDPQDAGNTRFNYSPPRTDAFGQRYYAYLGPPFAWNAQVVAEPEGGAAMRADGVLVDAVTLPDEE